MPGYPPRPQRVMQQEFHHIRLGEQLGHRRQFVRADFHLRSVDLILPFRLPELIDPTQAVAGGEDLGSLVFPGIHKLLI